MCKILKIITFFILKLMNINIWIPPKINYNENLTIFKSKFYLVFIWGGVVLFIEVGWGGFVFKLGAAKVIRQYICFFTWSFSKIVTFKIILKKHNFSLWKSWLTAKCNIRPTFLQWFWPSKSCKFFPRFQLFTKILIQLCLFFRIWALKTFFWKDDNIFAY